MPSISLVTSEALSTTEQELSMEWIDPEGVDEQVRCGARDVGNHSLSYDKNNIRLSFRGDYGTPSLSLDLFADFAQLLMVLVPHELAKRCRLVAKHCGCVQCPNGSTVQPTPTTT